MSREDIEILCAVYERWSRGDFWTPEVCDPDVETGVLDVRTGRGLAGLETGIREWFKAWRGCGCRRGSSSTPEAGS